LNSGDGVHSLEKVCTTCGVLDVGVDEERVGFRVNVLPVGQRSLAQCKRIALHHDLETVEALGLGGLDLGRESLDKVLVDDTIRLISARSRWWESSTYSSEESEDVLDKVSLIVVELVVPIVKIGCEVDLLGCPESDD